MSQETKIPTAAQPELETMTLEIDGDVGTLTLNRPDDLNSMSPQMIAELAVIAPWLADRTGLRALVITGAGRGFSAGGDVTWFRKGLEDPDADLVQSVRTGADVLHQAIVDFKRIPFPIVAAVNGPAAGAGMSFALLGDMILCARSAYFLQAFRRIGLVPDCGSTWMLPRLVGKARAIELSLLGERLPAEKALEWGLVNRVHDDAALMDEAMKLAHELANGPTIALSLIRKLYWDSPENSFEEQLNLEFESQRIAGSAEDFKEGVTAFLEKRPAKFKGK